MVIQTYNFDCNLHRLRLELIDGTIVAHNTTKFVLSFDKPKCAPSKIRLFSNMFCEVPFIKKISGISLCKQPVGFHLEKLPQIDRNELDLFCTIIYTDSYFYVFSESNLRF